MMLVQRVPPTGSIRVGARTEDSEGDDEERDEEYECDGFTPTPRHAQPESDRWKLAQSFPEGAKQALNDKRLVVDEFRRFILPVVDVVSHVVPHHVVKLYQRHCSINQPRYYQFATRMRIRNRYA